MDAKKQEVGFRFRIQTNQILTNDDEVCIPRRSSILLAVLHSLPRALSYSVNHESNVTIEFEIFRDHF